MNARALPCDFLPLTRARRSRIELTIERLIAILDEIDGNPDMEDTGDFEPYLGGYAGSTTDAEIDLDWLGDWSDDPEIPQVGIAWHGQCSDMSDPGAAA